MYQGVRYFTCPAQRALFCYLHDCKTDRRLLFYFVNRVLKGISKFEKIVIARLTFIDHNNWVLLTQIPAGAPTHPISQRFEEMPEPVAPYYGPYISGVVIGPPAPPPVSLSPGVSIVFFNL